MPFPNEHAARILDPDQFDSFRRANDEGGDGIHFIFGIREKDGEKISEVQSIRFDSSKFSASEARAWLADHDFEPLEFEEATGEEAAAARTGWRGGHRAEAGLWMIEPGWWTRARALAGAFSSHPETAAEAPGMARPQVQDGIAVIPITGPMIKGGAWWGGTDTTLTRRQIREAAGNDDAAAILLLIDSPGGTVAGTQELAEDVRAADARKPVFAQIDDLGASAALWVASQARRVFANEPAEVGSIGTFAVVPDTSELFAKHGIKIHVVSTGEMKGAFVDGSPVTDAQLDGLRERVRGMNELFLSAVSQGRKMDRAKLNEIADGRVWLAREAHKLGLLDGVQSFDATINMIREQVREGRMARRKRAVLERLDRMSAEPRNP